MCYLSLPTGIEVTILYCEIRQPSWAIFLFHVQINKLLEKMPPSICEWLQCPQGWARWRMDYNLLQPWLLQFTTQQAEWKHCIPKSMSIRQHWCKEAILFNQLITKHKTYAGPLAVRTHWKVSAPTSILLQEFSAIRRHNFPCRFVLR